MISTINYLKLKNILLKNFRNTRVLIESRGIFNSRTFLENTRITINKNKIIISNEEKDIIVEFAMLKKVKFFDSGRFELIYNDITILFEL